MHRKIKKILTSFLNAIFLRPPGRKIYTTCWLLYSLKQLISLCKSRSECGGSVRSGFRLSASRSTGTRFSRCRRSRRARCPTCCCCRRWSSWRHGYKLQSRYSLSARSPCCTISFSESWYQLLATVYMMILL